MRNVLVLGLIAMLWTAGPARACWDGEALTVGDVTYTGGHVGWDPDRARELATWLTRIDALLGPEAQLEVYWDGAVLQDPRRGVVEWERDGRSLAALFREVALHSGASPEEVRRARTLAASPVTVQVAAVSDRARAEQLAERITGSGAGEHGYYETGGFPADNPTAHVVTGADARGRTVHRVVVGAFVDRAHAEQVRDRLAEQLGLRGRVRLL